MLKTILKTLLKLLCLSLSLSLFAQNEPSSAPKLNAFNLNPDNVGALANSVNLFSGELNLPMNLVSIEGGGGLGIDVSILYNSSNIENVVDVWNLDAPTGILGLGWSMQVPSIVVDNKQTGARDDDTFYLLEGGVSTQLVRVGGTTVRIYKAKTNPFWNITYTPALEKWEITKDDGMRYVYGDQNSNRNAVQWLVKWGNWIGDSGNITNQQQQALVWNLSEIRNVWDDYIQYAYTNLDRQVGYGGLFHTEASYLYKITDRWGREVEFAYQAKLAGEFIEPHTENGSDVTDAYQERYERQYLDKIYVRGNGSDFYTVQLGYATNLLGTGNLMKRLLTSIVKVAPSGEQLPALGFNYLTSGPMRGALNQVTTQMGGIVTYEYHSTGVNIAQSKRDRTISAPNGYAEPRVLIENGYSVVTWRQLNAGVHDTTGERDVKVFAYTWDGQWRERDLGSIGTVKLSDYPEYKQDFQTVLGKDFFAILKPISGLDTYWLYIWHRNEKIPGDWIQSSFNINLDSHDHEKEKLLAGDNFVVVSNSKGKIFRYVWNGGTIWNLTMLNESEDSYVAAANNYIITQGTSAVKLYHLDEENIWSDVKTPGAGYLMLGAGFDTAGETFWYPSNSFAFAMAASGNEFAFHWNQDYLYPQKINMGFQYNDNSYVKNTGSMVSVNTTEYPGPGKLRASRYTGTNWIDGGEKTIYNFTRTSVGDDLLLWQENVSNPTYISKSREFNPNTNSWKTEVSYTENLLSSYRIGPRYFLINDKIYYRNTNGTWTSQTQPNLNIAGSNYFVGGLADIRFLKGQNFVTANAYYNPDHRTVVAKNGNVDPFFVQENAMVNGTTMISCQSSLNNNFVNADELIINRIISTNVIGELKDYPLVRTTVNDGVRSYYNYFDYDAGKATYEPSGVSPRYNLVKTFPGSSSTSPVNGYTEIYFFNTLTQSELGEAFPAGTPVSEINLLTGLSYRTKYFDSGYSLVGEANTTWNVKYLTTLNSNSVPINLGVIPRVDKSISIRDGIEIQTENTYDANTNQLRSQRVVTLNSSGYSEIVENEYVYSWEEYPTCETKNIRNAVVQTTRKINNGTYAESSVTRWKDWGGIPAPVDNYTWNGTGSHVFTDWDANTDPSPIWVLGNKINQRDGFGRPLEVESRGNQIRSTLWGVKPIANVANARFNQFVYKGFEDATASYSMDAKVGAKSSSGPVNVNLPSAGTYTLTYWKKESGGNWEFIESTISSNTVIGGSGILIDEVRLLPFNASMTTYGYDVMGNTIAVCGPNSVSVRTDYDAFNRPVVSKDEDGNILKYTFYRIKN